MGGPTLLLGGHKARGLEMGGGHTTASQVHSKTLLFLRGLMCFQQILAPTFEKNFPKTQMIPDINSHLKMLSDTTNVNNAPSLHPKTRKNQHLESHIGVDALDEDEIHLNPKLCVNWRVGDAMVSRQETHFGGTVPARWRQWRRLGALAHPSTNHSSLCTRRGGRWRQHRSMRLALQNEMDSEHWSGKLLWIFLMTGPDKFENSFWWK